MDSLKKIFKKLLSFLKIRAAAAGLEISDQVLRLIYEDKGAWHMEALRLAPGIMEKGKILDAPALIAALRELKMKVPSGRGAKKINVVVAFSSVNIYSQVFSLPIMQGEELDKAIDLNVQMASPMDINHAYFGWQILGRDEATLRSEIAAAFVDKTIVDDTTQALYDAGFITVGVESRALALTRVLREQGAGIDPEQSYILLDIDSAGIDFMIIRKGKLYFEYANPWTDLADEKGEIAVDKFETALEASLRQVMNFYSQHWPEQPAGIILCAAAFQEEAEKAIAASLALPVFPLMLAGAGSVIAPEWYIAFGCGLRGLDANTINKEINLSGSHALDIFHEEQLVGFLALWRILVPAVLVLLVVALGVADVFLQDTRASVESQSVFSANGSATGAVAALEASSTAFNTTVALVANAEGQVSKNYLLINDLNTIATANGIMLNSISFQSKDTPILVAGVAQAATQIDAFKNQIQGDSHFGAVTLPLLNIQQNGSGGYSFSMSFSLIKGF